MRKHQFVDSLEADTVRQYLEETGHDTSQDYDDEIRDLLLLGIDEGIFTLQTHPDGRGGTYQTFQIEHPLPLRWGVTLIKPMECNRPAF